MKTLNQTKLANKLIAILLIFCMTFANFALVGSSVVEAAADGLENQETIKKGDNIEFDAYLDKSEKTHEAELNVEEAGTLYLKVAVKDKVSVQDATIKIKDANFSIDKEAIKENKYVSNVDTEKNEIQLSSISSNNTAEIEVPINFKKQDTVKSDYFNKEVEITLEGTYQDTNRSKKKLEGTVKVKPQWTANADTKVSQSIEKYFSLGTNGTLVQQKIETEVINHVLPIATEKVVTSVPMIANERPQEVTVLIDGQKIAEDQIEYNRGEGTVTIYYKNGEDEIAWEEAKKEYTIMYHYAGTAEVTETPMTLSTNVQTSLYSKDKEIEKVDFQELQVTPIGNIATTESTIIGEIYKGYIYENEAKEMEYVERNDIGVSYTEGIDKVELSTNNMAYTDEQGQTILAGDNIKYKQTKINKAEMLQLLGEDGTVKIKRANGEEIVTVNKETETDEQGIVTINYDEGEANIIIETSKPQVEGKMTVLNTKTINCQMNQPKEVTKQIKQLVVNPETTTNISKEVTSAAIEVKETTTQAKLEISNNNLSTVQENENVEIKATLNTNSSSQDLYLNPSLEIVFPEDVQEVKVNGINKLYGDEFTEITPVQGVVEGKQTIRINLTGEQTAHKEAGTEGTVIDINANLKLNGKAVSKQEAMILNYTNEKANSYNEGAQIGTAQIPINVVSPKSLITTNEITELGITTYGEEEGIKQIIPVGAETRDLTIQEEVINNNESDIANVQVLGTFGTKGTAKIGDKEYQNTINASVVSPITVEGVDASKIRIYYTENENATADIENLDNRWQQTITNPGAAKKYLVVATDLAHAEGMKINYAINIPAGLEYKQEMYQGYVVTYNDNQAENAHQIAASTIELETGNGPQVQAAMTATVGSDELEENAQVNKGEIIRYNVNVRNTGDQEVENAKLSITIPENTTLVEYSVIDGYVELESKTVELPIETLKVGETKTVSYEVKVNSTAKVGAKIKGNAIVSFDQVTTEVSEPTLVVGEASGKLNVTVESTTAANNSFKQGDTIFCYMKVKNTTNEEIKNIETKWNIPEELELVSNRINGDYTSEESNVNKLKIESIQPGETAIVQASFKVVQNTDKGILELSGTASDNKETYRSSSVLLHIDYVKGIDFEISTDVGQNAYVKPGDIVNYYITARNNNDFDYTSVEIIDTLPIQMTIQEVTFESDVGTVNKVEPQGNKITWPVELKSGETKKLTIKSIVNYQAALEEDLQLVNKAEIRKAGELIDSTNETKVILGVEKPAEPTPSENPGQTTNPGENPQQQERTITGLAWVDGDLNGAKDDYENTVPNIPVRLLDTKTNEFVKDENGNEVVAYTDDSGNYTLENIPEGKYIVVFEYDATQYKVTEYMKDGVEDSRNSKAISKRIKVEDGVEKIYGVTDIIEIKQNTKVSGINIGLVTTGKFDFGLEKTISKVTVRTPDGNVKNYDYDEETLAKIELDSKKMDGANVIVEYDITVRNDGEVSGYVATIEDKVPTDLTFSSDLNKDWYEDGTVLKTNALANKAIAPGESKTIKLVLTKAMTENNTGISANTAEITEAYNEEGTQDINSIPGNNNKAENDYGAADLIVSVKTGSGTVYTILILVIVSIIGAGVYHIRKQTTEVNEDIFKGI